MNVRYLDEHLPGEDRDTARLLRHEAGLLEPARGPDLDEVVEAGRRHVRRRRATGVAAAAAVAVVGAGVTLGSGGTRSALPAAPEPRVTVTVVDRSPSDLYRGAEAAVADAGLDVEDGFRWRSRGRSLIAGVPIGEVTRRAEGLPPKGVPASGFYTQVSVPSIGAELLLVTSRLDEPLPAGVDHCAYYTEPDPEVTCTAGDLPAGRLVEVVHPDGRGAAAVAVSGSSVVHVESFPGTLGSGPQLDSPRHVPLDTLVRLATDVRLRW